MSEYMHLIGTEQVQSAAARMADAAERMNHAARAIDEAVARFERAVERLILDGPQGID